MNGRRRRFGAVWAVVWIAVFLMTGCATTNSTQMKGLIQTSEDPKYTEAMIAQLKDAGADDKIVQEHFALQQQLKDGAIRPGEYEKEMGKLQVRMDANRVQREKQRRNNSTAFSILQSVAGAALSALI